MKTPESYSLPHLQNSLIPLAFPASGKTTVAGKTILAGDIGATKTNLALFEFIDGHFTSMKEKSYHTKDFNAFIEMALTFLEEKLPEIDGICLGVAGPVTRGRVKGTNFPWE